MGAIWLACCESADYPQVLGEIEKRGGDRVLRFGSADACRDLGAARSQVYRKLLVLAVVLPNAVLLLLKGPRALGIGGADAIGKGQWGANSARDQKAGKRGGKAGSHTMRARMDDRMAHPSPSVRVAQGRPRDRSDRYNEPNPLREQASEHVCQRLRRIRKRIDGMKTPASGQGSRTKCT